MLFITRFDMLLLAQDGSHQKVLHDEHKQKQQNYIVYYVLVSSVHDVRSARRAKEYCVMMTVIIRYATHIQPQVLHFGVCAVFTLRGMATVTTSMPQGEPQGPATVRYGSAMIVKHINYRR